jgi:hypothetical protein
MRTFDESTFENFNEFLLTDEEMNEVRGGDPGDGKGTTTPPITEPEI